jgi:thiamine biosynthesis lipoprotein
MFSPLAPHHTRLFLQAAISCTAALAASQAAHAQENAGTFSYHAANILGTSLDLRIAASSRADADKAHEAVLEEIERLRSILSTYDPTAELGRINASRDAIKTAPELLEVLRLYDQWHTHSRGAFSGRVGPLVELWKEAEAAGKIPDAAKLTEAVEGARQPLWRINDRAGTVQRLSDRPINIDSLGKGFIISRAAATAREAVPAIAGLMLDVGGDITVMGSSSATSQQKWKIAVADPARPSDNAAPLTVLLLNGRSVATSGHYARGYKIAGRQYSHILDPRTGYPVDAQPGGAKIYVASATVIARNNAAANAMAASLCVLSPEEGLAIVNKTLDAEALLVLSDGTQLRSSGFARCEQGSNSTAASAWPAGGQVSIELQLKPVTGRQERAYVALWVEDENGKHVATLAEWGSNQRWLRSLSSWMRAVSEDRDLIKAVSRATRPAGKYTLTWDGRDSGGTPVAPGKYRINVETAYEHNGHSSSYAILDCGGEDATASISPSQHFDAVPLVYARGK